MKDLPILILFFYLVILLKYQTIKASSRAYPYIPVENIPLNCGSSGNQTAEYEREWMGDGKDSKFAPVEGPNGKSNTSRSVDLASAVDPVPYRTARISQFQFNYTFKVSPGPKFIRLYFYPTIYEGGFDSSMAFLDVKANNFTLLRRFSANLVAKYQQEPAIKKEFIVNVKEGHTLKLSFIPSPISSSGDSYAFVNGIEIVSMPAPLYYTPPEETFKIPSLIGQQDSQLGDYTNLALETLYRLNVGASPISPADDTGMYREWSEDTKYSESPGALPGDPTKRIRYTDRTPNYTAPENVYRTALTMGPDGKRNMASNLTWRLPVDSGFSYLVRLHFCEFQEWHSSQDGRIFNIYIDHRVAEIGFSIIQWIFGVGIPLYRDYVVDIKSEVYLDIDLHPSNYSVYPDVILNGMEVFKTSNSDNSLAGPNPAPSTTNTKSKKTLFISLGSGIGFFLIVCTVSFVVLWRLKRSKQYYSYHPLVWCGCWEGDSHKGRSTRTKASSTKTKGSSFPSDSCRYVSLAHIKFATNNFNENFLIGAGGFGNVYKGYIDDDVATPVAIKRLKPESSQGAHEFKNEIEMLSNLRHRHVVSLIGYCDDHPEMILVYEYMTRGTLSDHLYKTNNPPLSWKQRLKICIGAALGLHYLHFGAKQRIIHRDVKSANILLDEKWVAKVSDFGLSKVNHMSKSHVSTMVKGSIGYLDPEYYRRQQLTEKSDVYSFGVVLCEVLCGRPPVVPNVERRRMNLAEWFRWCYHEGTIDEIVDPHLIGEISPECLQKYSEIAVNCMLEDGADRPSMKEVAWSLELSMQLQLKSDEPATEMNGEYGVPVRSFSWDGTSGTVFSEMNDLNAR